MQWDPFWTPLDEGQYKHTLDEMTSRPNDEGLKYVMLLHVESESLVLVKRHGYWYAYETVQTDAQRIVNMSVDELRDILRHVTPVGVFQHHAEFRLTRLLVNHFAHERGLRVLAWADIFKA